MSPWFHPNFPSETLLLYELGPIITIRSLSISLSREEFFHRPSNKLFPAIFQKTSLFTDISTTFVWIQTPTSFPKFSKTLLPPAFTLTCLLTPCLLFILLIGSFILLKLLFLKFTMALSLQWILVKTLHSIILLDSSAAFDTVDHSILFTRLQNWFGLDGLSHLISLLALKQSQSMILHSISAFFTLSPGVPQVFVLGPHLLILYTTHLGSLMQKIPQISFVRWYTDETQLSPAVQCVHLFQVSFQRILLSF